MAHRADPCRWPSRRIVVAVAGVVIVQLVVLLVALGIGNDPIHPGDGPYYSQIGHNLAEHGVHSGSAEPPLDADVFRTPGYPGFLAAIYGLSGGSELAVRMVQVLLIGITALFVGAVAHQHFGARVANVAALASALYLPLPLFAVVHLTEVSATLLLTMGVWASVRAKVSDDVAAHLRWVGVATVLFGALALVRPSALVGFAALLLATLTWRSHSRPRRLATSIGASVCLCMLLVPWMLRNHELTGRFMPLGAASGVSLLASAQQYQGELPYDLGPSDFRDFYVPVVQRLEEVEERLMAADGAATTAEVQIELDEVLQRDARRAFGEVSPLRIARDAPVRLVSLWAPGAITRTLPLRLREIVHTVAQLQNGVYLLLSVAGAYLHRRRLVELWPLFACAVALTATHFVFAVEPRYTMPARPLLFVLGAACVVHVYERRLGEAVSREPVAS